MKLRRTKCANFVGHPTYNGGLKAEHPAVSRGKVPRQGSLKAFFAFAQREVLAICPKICSFCKPRQNVWGTMAPYLLDPPASDWTALQPRSGGKCLDRSEGRLKPGRKARSEGKKAINSLRIDRFVAFTSCLAFSRPSNRGNERKSDSSEVKVQTFGITTESAQREH